MSTVPPETMQRIKALRAEGLGLRKIAAVLQAERAPLPGRRKAWTHSGVSWCLQQELDDTAAAAQREAEMDELAEAVSAQVSTLLEKQEARSAEALNQLAVDIEALPPQVVQQLPRRVQLSPFVESWSIFDWSPGQWLGLVLAALLGASALGGVQAAYRWLVPPAPLARDGTTYRALWAAATPAERDQIRAILKRPQSQTR